MSKVFGFTYDEWMKRAVHERDIQQRRYKLNKAKEAAETALEAEFAEACREWVHVFPEQEEEPSGSNASPTIEVTT